MPKRKRLPAIPLIQPRPNKKRKKNTPASCGDSNSNNTNNKLTARSAKKQIIPKAALQHLDDPVDHLLFFNLLSQTKRPRSTLEWELMAQSFACKAVTGQTLRQFYSILIDHGSIDDPHFVNDDNEDDDIKSGNSNGDTSDNEIVYNIDLKSDQYQNAHAKFMEKLRAFIADNDDNSELGDDESINAKIFEKDVDLFYLYLLVTKRGGFDAVNANKQWMNILHEMTAHFNPHHMYEIIGELRSIYNDYLLAYEEIYFESELIDSVHGDEFGDDFYLENDVEIMRILSQYPLKIHEANASDDDPACYWLEMMRHGNNLRFMFAQPLGAKQDIPYNCSKNYKQNICVSGSDKTDLLQLLCVKNSHDDERQASIAATDCSEDDEDDDIENEEDIGSILKSMVYHEDNIIELTHDEIQNHRDYINKDLCVCNVKGMHPYTRKLIHWMLNECESKISLAEIEKISIGKTSAKKNNKRKSVYNKSASENLFKLTSHEIDYIVDVLVLKVLRLLCALNNRETSMMYAFEIGLNLLRKQYTDNTNGYSLYNGRYYIYYKRILSSFETFVHRAHKMAHNFLSHPKGLGIVCISSNLFAIQKGTFLSEIKGDLYAVPRWIEHSFCIENLYHKLLSGSRLNYTQYPVVMEYIGEEYNVLSVMNLAHSRYANLNTKHWTTFLNHSCEPNCAIKPFINDETRSIALGLFSIKNIVKGDELSINYDWCSSDDALCSESICLCGLRQCRGTYIAYKDEEIEDIYLAQNHDYISQRLVQLLLSTVTPLNEDEKKSLDTLYLTQYRSTKRRFGDWMYKYLAFISDFICAEYEDLPAILLKKIDRRNEYTLMDAQRDVNKILLRRVRSLSICVSRIKWYLTKQESLFSEILREWKQDKIPKYIKLFGTEHSGNTLFVPPIRFAEIDEIIARLWNDEDSLINRLLNCLSHCISAELYDVIQSIVSSAGLQEESQYGLYSIRCKLIEIAQILSKIKCTKINRHLAAADVLYFYANTYRFAKTQSYLSYASSYADCAVISHYRDIKVVDNRYLTRSVRKGTPPKKSTNNKRMQNDDDDDGDEMNKEPKLSDSERFIYSSSFPLICLLGWYHHDLHSVNGEEISKLQYNEYFANMYGTALLPDIESCYDPNCKGLYMVTHRNYLFKCMLERKSWMKLSYTKQYEDQHDSNMINSCPVPQFTFTNKIGLFGSPVFDSYFDGFDNQNNKYIKSIVEGAQHNRYDSKLRK